MTSAFRFNVGERRFKENEEEEVALYVAVKLGFDITVMKPFKKENGNWQLDAGNDYFLSRVEGEQHQYELRYRYGSEAAEKAIQGFVHFIEWKLK